MKSDISIFTQISSAFWLRLGRLMSDKGMLSPAEGCFQRVPVNNGPLAAEAAYELGRLYFQNDLVNETVAVCEAALQNYPYHARLLCTLGAAQRRLGDVRAAADAYQKAVTLDATIAQAWCDWGECCLAKGDAPTALKKNERALSLDAKLLPALQSRIDILYELSRFDEAEAAARTAIGIYPDSADLHASLAIVLGHSGKLQLGIQAAQKAMVCEPGNMAANMTIAALLYESHAEMLPYLENQIATKGATAQRLALLANAQLVKGDYAAAEVTCNKVLSIQRNNISALVSLAKCAYRRIDHAGAIALNERALAVNPKMPEIYSRIAFSATYLPNLSAQEVFDYQRGWSTRFEKNAGLAVYSHQPDGKPDRPLRIGYLSGDFGTHPVGYLFSDVIRHHDHKQFAAYCYSTTRRSDPLTATIREHADSWVEAFAMTDEELAVKIHADQIDILIDLSGHTSYNRLQAFAHKPAPVQATWIGYFCSTGLDSIDYFITDPHTTPVDSGQLFSETPARLPHSRFCFRPPEFPLTVSETPATKAGRVTFGSFNRQEKIVDSVIETWVKIVNAVPDSRLLLKANGFGSDDVREKVRAQFVAHGLAADRLELRAASPHADMLEQYGEVDIALDPFPFNGGITTLEALWMGVPVVTMAGQSVVSRQSTAILKNIGLPELIFADVNAYCEGTIALAQDKSRLQSLRQGMRERLLSSPVCQPELFAKDLEQLYRSMWQAWCRGEKLGNA